jgi:glyoxylase-like metal-dependent hydrolase (beta-lactamase superfamily II)
MLLKMKIGLCPKTLILILGLISAPSLFAQIDFSGEWVTRIHEDQPERIPGPELGDYLGLPINAAARMKADSWDASIQTLPEWQCRPHSADYIWRGPSTIRISKEVDPVSRQVVAFHAEWLRSVDRPIYLDGRPHPPAWAPHTWGGFSTAKWEGNMLTVTTTHLKEGYMRRNGLARSDRAVMTEHWIRHGNYLTVMTIVDDPVYLTEPLVKTTDFIQDPSQELPPYPCEMVQEVKREKGVVPHHLPGTNTFLSEFAERFKVSPIAARGGVETTRPGYRPPATASFADDAPKVAQRPVVVDDGDVHALRVRGNIYMLTGAGGNITLEAAQNGVVLLVDTGKANLSAKTLAAIKTVTDRPVRKIINTSAHADHTGGNMAISQSGATLINATHVGDLDLDDAAAGAAIIAHENVLKRMSTRPGMAFRSLPTETYFNDELKLSELFNGEPIQVFHVPSGHSDGDSMVWFRHTDVLSTGDVFDTTRYPVIDLASGGSLDGEVAALNKILDIAIPSFRLEGGTMIVPGHGRICDIADVAYYRDMVTIVRDRIREMIRQGKTLEQVKAARPTMDYDGLYGATTGDWTTDMFIEAAYRSLGGKAPR